MRNLIGLHASGKKIVRWTRRGGINFFVQVYVRAINIEGGTSACRPEESKLKSFAMPTISGLPMYF